LLTRAKREIMVKGRVRGVYERAKFSEKGKKDLQTKKLEDRGRDGVCLSHNKNLSIRDSREL